MYKRQTQNNAVFVSPSPFTPIPISDRLSSSFESSRNTDVYKRQGLHGGAVQRTVGVDGHLAGGIGNLLDAYDDLHSFLAPFRLLQQIAGDDPVSYTHLDVYKRQGRSWTGARRMSV